MTKLESAIVDEYNTLEFILETGTRSVLKTPFGFILSIIKNNPGTTLKDIFEQHKQKVTEYCRKIIGPLGQLGE